MPHITPSEKLKIDVVTFDAQYLMQFRHNGVTLLTVGTPSGPSYVTRFEIYEADGVDDETSDNLEPLQTYWINGGASVEQVWKDAVRAGYRIALDMVFKGDTIDYLFQDRLDGTRKEKVAEED